MDANWLLGSLPLPAPTGSLQREGAWACALPAPTPSSPLLWPLSSPLLLLYPSLLLLLWLALTSFRSLSSPTALPFLPCPSHHLHRHPLSFSTSDSGSESIFPVLPERRLGYAPTWPCWALVHSQDPGLLPGVQPFSVPHPDSHRPPGAWPWR